MIKIQPKGDRVIVREANPGETMIGGIAAVQTNPKDDQLMRAEVLAVGDGKPLIPTATVQQLDAPCKVGDIVLVPRYQGWEVKSFYTSTTDTIRMYSFAEVLAGCE